MGRGLGWVVQLRCSSGLDFIMCMRYRRCSLVQRVMCSKYYLYLSGAASKNKSKKGSKLFPGRAFLLITQRGGVELVYVLSIHFNLGLRCLRGAQTSPREKKIRPVFFSRKKRAHTNSRLDAKCNGLACICGGKDGHARGTGTVPTTGWGGVAVAVPWCSHTARFQTSPTGRKSNDDDHRQQNPGLAPPPCNPGAIMLIFVKGRQARRQVSTRAK